MDRLRVVYFLEDRAQEEFIVALVERIASDLSMPQQVLSPAEVISARGGCIRVVEEFNNFVRDLRKAKLRGPDVIVVAVDADCVGFEERAKQLIKKVRDDDPFRDAIACAIPDPHVERWYLLDPEALKRAVGLKKGIEPPAYKCEKDYYKNILRTALRDQRITSLLGGPEFGREIAGNISDLYSAGRHDPSFAKFVGEVKRVLRRAAHVARAAEPGGARSGDVGST
ncbi:MAG: hypothetical protein Q8Q12_18650 [bacterium]|nr:hypothetical protein [bacterium]